MARELLAKYGKPDAFETHLGRSIGDFQGNEPFSFKSIINIAKTIMEGFFGVNAFCRTRKRGLFRRVMFGFDWKTQGVSLPWLIQVNRRTLRNLPQIVTALGAGYNQGWNEPL